MTSIKPCVILNEMKNLILLTFVFFKSALTSLPLEEAQVISIEKSLEMAKAEFQMRPFATLRVTLCRYLPC